MVHGPWRTMWSPITHDDYHKPRTRIRYYSNWLSSQLILGRTSKHYSTFVASAISSQPSEARDIADNSRCPCARVTESKKTKHYYSFCRSDRCARYEVDRFEANRRFFGRRPRLISGGQPHRHRILPQYFACVKLSRMLLSRKACATC